MSYNPRPNPSGDTLRASRDPIRTNFEVIQSRFEDDHTEFSSGSGKHDKSTYPEQTTAPTTLVNEGAVYTKESDGETNLFFRRENNGEEIPLTGFSSVDDSTYANNTEYDTNMEGGWTSLPGGLILQYGRRKSLSSGNNTVNFPRSFPNEVFSIVITPVRNKSNVDIVYVSATGTVTTTAFVMRNTASGINDAYWHAIGN